MYYILIINFFKIIGTIVGLIWTFIVSTVLIDLLDFYILIFKLDNTYMGLTILGIGNINKVIK